METKTIKEEPYYKYCYGKFIKVGVIIEKEKAPNKK
jgi:hypothetical protein